MRKLIFILFTLIVLTQQSYAQISAPGLGDIGAASWFALGLRQDLDSLGHKESMTYIGIGRSSQPNNYRLFSRQNLFVVNEEFHHKFARNWQYSVALSYRRQNMYSKQAPYQKITPKIKQEIRAYGRFAYVYALPKVKFALTFREEFRSFFNPDFSTYYKNIQLRTRIRAQVKVNLDQKKIHRVALSVEPLFKTQHNLKTRKWSKFDYSDIRFALYYSYSPKKIPFVFDVGYMNYLTGKTKPTTMHYLGVDVVWTNPFGKPHKSNAEPIEYLE